MKKISILTLVGANNIGAYLQAFALKTIFEKYGYSVEFLIVASNKAKRGRIGKIIRYLKTGNILTLAFKIKSDKKYSEARSLLNIKKYDLSSKYNCVVIGSDEMWNVISKSFEHFPEYFGKGINSDITISYAPSAGNSTYTDLLNSKMDFSSFDKLSVRDQRTYDLLKRFGEREVVKVLDPTFLLDSYAEFIPEIGIKKDFIMVYSYGMTNQEIKMAKDFAEKVKLPLYSIGTYNSWCHKNINVSPFEFLAYLQKAKYVLAATFHGTAFSIRFNKQFVSCVEESEKLRSLLKDFELENRMVTTEHSISQLFEKEIDYESVNKIITKKRKISLNFLEDALGISEKDKVKVLVYEYGSRK